MRWRENHYVFYNVAVSLFMFVSVCSLVIYNSLLQCSHCGVCDLLTHWSAAGPRASPWDLLSVLVHTPAVSRAAVALRGFIGAVLVACGDVLSSGGPWAPRTKLCRTQETVSVGLTLRFCPL